MARTSRTRGQKEPGLPRAPTRRRLRSPADAVTSSLASPRALLEGAAVRVNWTFAEVARTALVNWLDRHQARLSRGVL
jgi:hypothetical protein